MEILTAYVRKNKNRWASWYRSFICPFGVIRIELLYSIGCRTLRSWADLRTVDSVTRRHGRDHHGHVPVALGATLVMELSAPPTENRFNASQVRGYPQPACGKVWVIALR